MKINLVYKKMSMFDKELQTLLAEEISYKLLYNISSCNCIPT